MSDNTGSRLVVLSNNECMRLLASSSVGRVIYTDGALPAVTPVNFALFGNTVLFCTSADSRLARATEDAVVAFEVDRIDEVRQTGWSVVVTGVARGVRDAGELARIGQLGLVSWADGGRNHYVRVVPGSVTGRRIAAGVESFA
jgi:nitroimidazol reductase NimA-like FMN-containing flavoprotein (pyridoxamine 5'-phosphate oxidase superfamily)